MRTRLCILAVLAAMLFGCAAPPPPAQIPTGTYISNSGAGEQEFKLSGSDYVLVVGGASTVQGNYTSTATELTLTTSDLSSFCRGTLTAAVYTWTLNNNLLTLTSTTDGCDYRSNILNQTWQKR